MAYVIRDGKLEKAKHMKNLTPIQKTVLKMSTTRQSAKLRELKAS